MPAKLNIIGRTFGRLFVVREAPPKVVTGKLRKKRMSWVICRCGNQLVVSNDHLSRGKTRSCGCLHREQFTRTRWKHGHAGTGNADASATYKSWRSMIQRCEDPHNIGFRYYGGRGVTVCDRWRHSFEHFLSDMGERASGTSIDRYPNRSGNYEPGNCRWATRKQQNRNASRNVVVTYRGITACVSELCELFGGHPTTVRHRLKQGQSVESAFRTVA